MDDDRQLSWPDPIPVTERLPEDGQHCLFWVAPLERWVAGVFRPGVKSWLVEGVVTHWLPEPPPPGKESDGRKLEK